MEQLADGPVGPGRPLCASHRGGSGWLFRPVDKPHPNYLTEYCSYHPQTGIGVMPKRGLNVSSYESFCLYKMITTKGLIEPVSMIIPQQSESYQEDIYSPMARAQPFLRASEWLSGMNKRLVLVSLRPGSELLSPWPLPPERLIYNSMVPALTQTEKLVAEDSWRPFSLLEEKALKDSSSIWCCFPICLLKTTVSELTVFR